MLRLPQADRHPVKDTSHWKATDNSISQTNTHPKQARPWNAGPPKVFRGVQGGWPPKKPPWFFLENAGRLSRPTSAISGRVC